MDNRKELGVNSIQEKVREMRLRWYGHMQRMEENNDVRAVVDMIVQEKDQGGDQEDRTFRKSRIRAADQPSGKRRSRRKSR